MPYPHPPMTIRDLQYVVAVADLEHFGRAAEACNVSQPTLSAQVRKIEEVLGIALFERTNRQVSVTPAGREIIAQARTVLAEAERLLDMASGRRDPMTGPLKLGVIPTVAPYLLPFYLPLLRRMYPQLKLFLREDLTGHLLDQLAGGSVDAVLLALPVEAEGIVSRPLFSEPFLLALPAAHPLAEHERIVEGDLSGQSVLLLEDGHCLRDQALPVCARMGGREHEAFRATSLETLRQMVAGGIGLTLLPALAARPPVTPPLGGDLIELRPFADPPPSRVIGLCWRRSFPRAATLETLVKLFRSHLPPGVTLVEADATNAVIP